VQLDAERLRDLQVFNQKELEDIGRRAIDAISQQLDELDRAVGGQDLAAAGEAAHRARNEALLLGARELAEAFQSVEDATRADLGSGAAEAAVAARALWPPTREAIARATYGATG
jgi:HPt (histidine-containing phosphotransfer) domain-containing protein